MRMWSPIPNADTYRRPEVRLIGAGWTLPIFALAVMGAVVTIRRAGQGGLCTALFLLAPALYLSIVHSVFVGSVRYRLPAMPMIEILAAAALGVLLQRSARRSATEESGARRS